MKNSNIQWIGEIPDDWEVLKVKDGFYRKKAKAFQKDPVVLSLARSGINVRDISTNEGQLAESYYEYNPVDIEDILINPMDLISGDNCNISKTKGVISPAYINLRYKLGFNPYYYNYYFKIQYWTKAFFAHGKGVSYENRWTLNNETLMKYPILVPPLPTQTAIAAYLDAKCSEIDGLIADINKQIETLNELKKSTITEAVTKGLNKNAKLKDSGIQWIGMIPEGWSVSRVKYLGKSQNGISKGGEFFGEGFPFVSYGDVYKNISIPNKVEGLIRSTQQEQINYSVKYGDIFFTRTSETIEEIGFSSVCLSTLYLQDF
ncbi:MAG: restriction endonuclease subunit S [Bacteroidales bacterium]|nr:restriction endonuclease subunit S [Bacteroidales bacterium]